MISVVAVAAIYMTMNISFIGVIPWQQIGDTVATTFVERLYGPGAASIVTIFVAITAFASIFAMFLGYSRIPYFIYKMETEAMADGLIKARDDGRTERAIEQGAEKAIGAIRHDWRRAEAEALYPL